MRILLTLLLLAASAFAQEDDVCTQQVATGLTAATNISNINKCNFGQSFNVLITTLRNAPSQTCIVPTIVSTLQASVDGISYFVVPNIALFTNAKASDATVTSAREARWTGAYPFMRVITAGFDTTNCVADVYYFGAKLVWPSQVFSTTAPLFTAAAGDTVLVANTGASLKGTVCVKGLYAYNQTAAQTLKITAGPAGATMLRWTAMPAGFNVVLPVLADGSVYGCTGLNDLVVNLANATEVDMLVLWEVH